MDEGIKKIKSVRLSRNVTEQLIDLIMSGKISPGEKLPPEKKLMDSFGIGRSSLREAIRALEALGLVEVKVPEGTFVSENLADFFTKQLTLMSKIGFDNISELIEARLTIETQIAILAAKKATPEDIEDLDKIITDMRNSTDDDIQFHKHDLSFHKKLSEMSRNSFLIQVMNILQEITSLWIKKVIPLEGTKPLAVEQHTKILESIKKRDAEGTFKAIDVHLKHVSDLLIYVNEQENRMGHS